ncbi:MAG: peptidase domain-containing ABC transporter [Muribaculaceae bacterium]|nr:peptidase domain-containing ABC transporter [Muribaculaceae bacterium]
MKRKIIAYQQLEHSDCGIVCVRILLRYWGRCMSLNEIRAISDMGRDGLSIKGISDTLGKADVDSIAVRLPMSELCRMPLPAILFWRQSHFVVLYKVSSDGKRFYVADPSQGKMVFTEQEMRLYWLAEADRGIALLCEPSDNFIADKKAKGDRQLVKLFNLVKSTLSQHRRCFFTVVLFTLCCLIVDIALPFLFQRTIDEGVATHNISLIWMLVSAQLMFFLGNFVSQKIVDWVLTHLGLKVGLDMMNEYLCKLLSRPMDFFARKVNSDLIQKAEDQMRIKDFLVGMPNTIFFMCLNIAVFSSLLIYFNIYIYLFFMICTGAGFLWIGLFMRKRKAIDYTYTSCIAENRNNLYELIGGVAEIKINNADEIKVSVWNKLQNRINDLAKKRYYIQLWMASGTTLLFRLREIAVIGICATSVVYGNMTIGVMMTVSYIIGRLASPFDDILDTIAKIQDASVSMERVEEIMHAALDDDADDAHIPVKDIDITDVSFKYPGSHSPFVLTDINLTIPLGSTIALVGPSGCGKSTLIKIIMDLFQPASGAVKVGGIVLSALNQKSWQKNCGIVMQEGTVFTGTLLSNIAMSDEIPDTDKAIAAVRLACLYDFIQGLPMGLYTKIGVSGIELSGGQKQRLLIARALYRNPDLLILDEATSSLDAMNEAQIVRNLKSRSNGKTVIIAAHRLSTIMHADTIVYMNEGRILEIGSHNCLMSLNGAYSRLFRGQIAYAEQPLY